MSSKVLFESVAPQFVVEDVVVTAWYYQDVLGFEITDYFHNPPVHAIVTRGESQIFLAKATNQVGISNRVLKSVGIDAYFRVRGVEQLAEELSNKGANILEGPIVRTYDIRELVIQDCNGFVLVFGEDVEQH